MLNKKTFINTINSLIKYRNIEDKVNSIYRDNEIEFNSVSAYYYEDIIVKLLEESMGDKEEWISWWIYEMDMGKDVDFNSVAINNKSVDLRTPCDLYDFLIKEYGENNE